MPIVYWRYVASRRIAVAGNMAWKWRKYIEILNIILSGIVYLIKCYQMFFKAACL